jgi:hypothetical protein
LAFQDKTARYRGHQPRALREDKKSKSRAKGAVIARRKASKNLERTVDK